MKVKGKTTVDLYLSLSAREAVVLMTVLGSIGGEMEEGPRSVTSAIYNELEALGVEGVFLSGGLTLPETWEAFMSDERHRAYREDFDV